MEDFPAFFQHLNDKAVHGAEYFFLQLFACRAFEKARAFWLRQKPLATAFGYCLLMGALTEGLQLGSRVRAASPADFAADASGAALMAVLLLFLKKRKTT